MRLQIWLAWAGIVLACLLAMASQRPAAPLVRLAEIEVDPARLAEYKAALTEEIEKSIRLEPGVLALQAVALKDNPAQIRILEIYASREAYESHLQTPHFRRYKEATQGMVKSLRLLDAEPVMLGAKAQ
ncbi:MAG: putative quinol monooxygenase [Bryobacteraceae bacterium]|jgi:quinol monooxygenase YgiN